MKKTWSDIAIKELNVDSTLSGFGNATSESSFASLHPGVVTYDSVKGWIYDKSNTELEDEWLSTSKS